MYYLSFQFSSLQASTQAFYWQYLAVSTILGLSLLMYKMESPHVSQSYPGLKAGPFLYFLKKVIELIDMILVNKIIQVLCAQFYKTSSVHCVMYSPSLVNSPSIYPPFTIFTSPPFLQGFIYMKLYTGILILQQGKQNNCCF